MGRLRAALLLVAFVVLLSACRTGTQLVPGPDQQFSGMLEGAASGAGAGAVTGFQVGAGTGPGAAVGAGLGAVAGGLHGMIADQSEENLLRLSAASQREREKIFAQEVLSDQFRRRLQLHPSREIYPADLFFYGDESKLRPEGLALVRELAALNKQRLPWSRMVVAAYVKASDSESKYAKHLAERRSREICVNLVRAGIEPRRLEARGVVIDEPLLVDPVDKPDRYNQALELIPADR